MIVCKDCGKEKKHHAHGMCATCVMRERRKKYPDENARVLKKHYYKHHQRNLSRAREYYWDDPIKRFVHGTNESSARRGRIGYIPRSEIETLFPLMFAGFPAGNCTYCNCVVIPGANATLDHLNPNGLHEMSNVVVACTSCNSSRRDTSVESFKLKLKQDAHLLAHIIKRNDSALAAFLVERYEISTAQIMELIMQQRL